MTDELRPAPAWANLAANLTRRLPRAKSRLIAWMCEGSNRRFLARMAPELGGYEFDCSLRDMISRQVFFAGCFAAQEIAFLRGMLTSGMSFVDVGANWGLFTLVASHLVGNVGRVIALEPDPRLARKLRFNLEHNQLNQVEVLEVAASDRDGECILAGNDPEAESWAASRLVESSSSDEPSFRVRSSRLDDLMDEAALDRVHLVKIDVEGAEDLVLAGMETGLARHRYERILLELHPRLLAERSRSMGDVTSLLAGKGYTGYALDCSPNASRKAYYYPWRHFSEFIVPLERAMDDAYPHTVWISPDLAPLSW